MNRNSQHASKVDASLFQTSINYIKQIGIRPNAL